MHTLMLELARVWQRIMYMCIILQIIMSISPWRISLHTLMLTLTTLLWNEVHWLLCHHFLMELAEWWTLCHPSRYGWWRKRTNLLCRVRSPDELKRLKNLLETWMCLKGRKLIMKKWIIHFSRPHIAIFVTVDEIDIIFFTNEVYGSVSCTNSSAGWTTQSYWVGPRQWMYKSHDWWQKLADGHWFVTISSEAYHLRWQRQNKGIGSR